MFFEWYTNVIILCYIIDYKSANIANALFSPTLIMTHEFKARLVYLSAGKTIENMF